MTIPLDRSASLHARLRLETQVAHERVEAAFDLPAQLASLDAFRALLGRLWELHAAFEAGSGAALAGLALPCKGRSALIRQDLAAIGGTPNGLTPCAPLAALVRTRAGAVGAAYVLEGSALGGLLIAREAASRLGLGPGNGLSFFAGEGRATAAGWRAFCAALDQLGPAVDVDAAVAAADETFVLVAEWLAARPVRQAA